MKNKLADGKTARHTAAADIVSGGIVLLLDRVGVAVAPIASGEVGVLDMTGGVYKFTLDSALGADKAKGLPLYLAADQKESDGGDLSFDSGAGKTLVGHLEEPAASGATEVIVRLAEQAIVAPVATELTLAEIKTGLGINADSGNVGKFLNEKGTFVGVAVSLGIDAADGDEDKFLNEKGAFAKPV